VLSAQPNPSCRTHPTSRRCRWLRQDLPHRNPRWHRRPLHGRPRLHAHRTRRRRSAPRSQDRSRARETLVARDPLDARSTSHRPLEPLPLFNQSRARPWAPAAFTIMRQKAARCASPLSSKALVRALAFTSLLSQPHAAGRASRNECARREGGKGPPLREEERAAARDEVRDGSRGAGVVLPCADRRRHENRRDRPDARRARANRNQARRSRRAASPSARVWNGRQIQEYAGTDKRLAQRVERQRRREVREGTYRPDRNQDRPRSRTTPRAGSRRGSVAAFGPSAMTRAACACTSCRFSARSVSTASVGRISGSWWSSSAPRRPRVEDGAQRLRDPAHAVSRCRDRGTRSD
jgi:hypothetical protein